MAHIERKAYYVGTWREDVVTDTTMRQIIARSHAEKGQKVKVRLSKEGISLSKTVLFQENFLSSFPLRDVYFLTVNQRHPTCLLCIVADPVKRYLILAIRTLSPVEAQEIIATFQSLKENPTINAGNVVLKRKENGNWTLRERSQHNADRHLQEIFKESSSPTSVPAVPTLQPNGNAGGYAPVLDGRKYVSNRHNHAGSQTVVDGSEGDVASMKNEVEQLSQELRDIKFVLEKAGTVSPAVLNSHNHINNNNNNNTDKSHYVLSEVHARGGHPATNGGIVTAYSDGDGNHGNRPGEARVTVEDYRNHGVARAHSNGRALPDKPAVVMGNGVVQRQIAVPEPNTSSTGTPTLSATVAPAPAAQTSNGFSEVPAYTVHRHVTTELVQVPDVGRKLSTAESARSSLRVKFDPESVRRSQDRHHQFRSLRTSRSSGVPSTIVRPIEQIYGHSHGPLVVPVGHSRPSILKRQAAPPGDRHMPVRAVYVAQQQQQQPSNAVYVAQTNAPNHPQPQAYMTAPPHPVRRSRPNSVHVMDGSELKVFHKTGELDDVLL